MNKLNMESKDIVNENIEKISKLFPNVIVESENGKSIDFDLLKQELSKEIIERNKEKYQLTWPGKKEAILTANTPINKTLRPVKEKSVDFDNTQNIYIEGDNLEALKILQESYLNKIKCIYIDPPYNTGNDFIYNDKFINENELKESGQIDEYSNRLITNTNTNGKYHSDWLSMMYPRLKLARNLLTKDGIIFISIDDNEQANLKKVCDEIFGESNFLTCVTRATGTPTGGGFDGLVNELDYMLIYAKNISFAKINGLPMSEEDSKIYDQQDENGRYLIRPLRRTGGEDRREDRPTMYFPLTAPDGTLVYPIGPTGYESRWICSPETAKKLAKDNLLEWKKVNRQGQEIWQVYQKFYLENRTKAPGNLWSDVEGNKKATRDIRTLFENNKVFDFPKPIGFLKKVLQIGSDKDSIILDFFSGSGTTANAVVQLNAEDGGNRKFIMIQVPERCDEKTEAFKSGFNNICEIGQERIKRAGQKIKEETNADIDYGFRVYKVDSSNMKNVYYEPSKLKQSQLDMFESNIKDDRTSEDLLTQVMLDLGLTLDLNIKEKKILNNNVYFVESNSLVGCFDNTIDINIIDEICKIKPLKLVFKGTSFKNDSEKINTYEKIKKLSQETEVNII